MNKINFFSAVLLILIGIISRFFLANYVGIPNFEAITAITLISSVFLGGVWTFVVPLSIIAIKDVIMGNNSVLFFTWSAFAIIGIFGWLSRSVILKDSAMLSLRGAERRSNPLVVSKNTGLLRPSTDGLAMTIIGMFMLGVGSSIFFFLYTNFGWWLISNMYPHTLDGLVQAYIMGIPFFKNNLLGNLIFVPLFSGVAMAIEYSIKNKIWRLKNILATRSESEVRN